MTNSFDPYILSFAFAVLVVSVLGFNVLSRSGKVQRSNFYFQIAWVCIALFPVLVIFSIFPSSKLEGTVLGFSVAGAFGGWVFVWWFGSSRALKALDYDQLQAEASRLEKELADQKAIAPQKGFDEVLPSGIARSFTIRTTTKKITLITGNIFDFKKADAWVNSENTNMQMARFFEGSVSGTIRFLGAKKDKNTSEIQEDVIAEDLARKVDGRKSVPASSVFVTTAGELEASHKVKRIFHVAAVQGEPDQGFRPVADLGRCVTRVLEAADGKEQSKAGIRSILFPILGTGHGGAQVDKVAKVLIDATITYLAGSPQSGLQEIFFIAREQSKKVAFENTLLQHERLQAA